MTSPSPPQDWPLTLDYPFVAVGDVHGQRVMLERLLEKLERLPDWDRCALAFVGDWVDRGHDVKGTIDLVIALRASGRVVASAMGNHDLALVRATGLDGRPPSPYWTVRYAQDYDSQKTFESYLGARPRSSTSWEKALETLRQAVPPAHRAFLGGLPWAVEAPGHVVLHCGLSDELGASPEEQLDAARRRSWSRAEMRPIAGTFTESLWNDEYPVWIGADRSLAERPAPLAGRVQVTGHVPVDAPQADSTRARLDTSGGFKAPLSAALFRGPDLPPEFVSSH